MQIVHVCVEGKRYARHGQIAEVTNIVPTWCLHHPEDVETLAEMPQEQRIEWVAMKVLQDFCTK
jgi:hypothetical protein